MAVNEIKIKETDSFLLNGKTLKHEPHSFSVQETGRTATTTFAHGGIVTKDDLTNNVATLTINVAFETQEQYEFVQKLVGVKASLKKGQTYPNAVLQSLPAVKLQEYVTLEFKAPTKVSL
jgi:hypothetical protein